jgi:hypothetical protein
MQLNTKTSKEGRRQKKDNEQREHVCGSADFTQLRIPPFYTAVCFQQGSGLIA